MLGRETGFMRANTRICTRTQRPHCTFAYWHTTDASEATTHNHTDTSRQMHTQWIVFVCVCVWRIRCCYFHSSDAALWRLPCCDCLQRKRCPRVAKHKCTHKVAHVKFCVYVCAHACVTVQIDWHTDSPRSPLEQLIFFATDFHMELTRLWDSAIQTTWHSLWIHDVNLHTHTLTHAKIKRSWRLSCKCSEVIYIVYISVKALKWVAINNRSMTYVHIFRTGTDILSCSSF